MPQEPYRADFVSVVPQGCTAEQTLGWQMFAESTVEKCIVAGTESSGSGQVLVLPADELVRWLGLSAADAAKVRDGAAVVYNGAGPSVDLAVGSYQYKVRAYTVGSMFAESSEVTVPVVPDTFPPVPKIGVLNNRRSMVNFPFGVL